MRLKSAREDFEGNTLSAVTGPLRRLEYVGKLHDGNGTYGHWGLAKVYGVATARSAIDASHRVVLSEVLKRPLAALLEELGTCTGESMTEQEFLVSLGQFPPKPLSAAARAHLKSVLSALSGLVESPNIANLRGASPRRQPGQESRPPADI